MTTGTVHERLAAALKPLTAALEALGHAAALAADALLPLGHQFREMVKEELARLAARRAAARQDAERRAAKRRAEWAALTPPERQAKYTDAAAKIREALEVYRARLEHRTGEGRA